MSARRREKAHLTAEFDEKCADLVQRQAIVFAKVRDHTYPDAGIADLPSLGSVADEFACELGHELGAEGP
jgi:hypothetical protein